MRVWTVVMVTAGALAGCAGVAPEPAAEPTVAASTGSDPAADFLHPGWRYDEGVVQAYRDALVETGADPPDDTEILRYASTICDASRQGKTDAQVLYDAAAHYDVDAAAASAIVDATKSMICPK